jgi:hypothetical protein
MPKGFSYSNEEMENVLDAIEEVLLISLSAWKKVAEVSLLRYPDLNQTVDSLKRKFKELHEKSGAFPKTQKHKDIGLFNITYAKNILCILSF